MDTKKNWSKNLENFRPIFLMLGLILSLIVVTEIFEYRGFTKYEPPQEPKPERVIAGVEIPRTWPDKPELPKEPEPVDPDLKKPSLNPDFFKPVDNNTVISRATIDIANLGLDTIGSEVPIDEPDPIPAVLVENMARPKMCAELSGKEEQMACFNRWIARYLAEEVNYPQQLQRMGVEEKIYMEFVINEFGLVESVVVKRGNEKEFVQEATRVLQAMPQFEPAKQLNRPVAVKVIVPVNFKLQ